MSRAGLERWDEMAQAVRAMDEWIGMCELVTLSDRLSCLRLATEQSGREMAESLSRHGQLTVVLCCRVSGTDALEVVDGFKRVRAARQLGWSELRVEIVVVATGSQSKLLLLQSNQGEALTDLEQAWVIRALYREDKLTQPRIAGLLHRDKSWVCRRLMLAEDLDPGVEADVRLGLLCVSAARELVRLPRGNQEACARVVVRRGLTTRQTAKLVDRLLLAEAAGGAAILAQAEKGEGFGARESGGKPVQGKLSHGEWLSVDVTALKRATVRLHARLLERPLASLGESAAALVRSDLQDLVPGLLSLNQTIEKACHDSHTGRSDE